MALNLENNLNPRDKDCLIIFRQQMSWVTRKQWHQHT